jgi:hypothetical protein
MSTTNVSSNEFSCPKFVHEKSSLISGFLVHPMRPRERGARMIAAHKLSRWLPWKTRAGQDITFKMPHRVHDELVNRLVGLVRDRVMVGRHRVTSQEAIAANRMAMALVLYHGGDMREFCVDRRGMSRITNLDLNEWLCRRAREILESIQFIERLPTFVRWRAWNPDAEPFDKSRARRQPTRFRFGTAFLGWLYYAVRKVRFRRSSQIQKGDFALTEEERALPSTGRTNHLGEQDQGLVLELKPRWRRDASRPEIQLHIPNLAPS